MHTASNLGFPSAHATRPARGSAGMSGSRSQHAAKLLLSPNSTPYALPLTAWYVHLLRRLPAKYCDLSSDATVTIRLTASLGPRCSCVLGSATLLLFSDAPTLHSAKRKLCAALEGRIGAGCARTRGLSSAHLDAANDEPAAEICQASSVADADTARLEALTARHEAVTAQTDMELDWLNRPTYARIEQQQHALNRRFERHFISVQMPEFEYAVHFHERAEPLPLPLRQLAEQLLAARGKGVDAQKLDPPSGAWSGLHGTPIVLVSDLEQHRKNPALVKHHKLARSLVSAGFAKELKPDAEERRRLGTLVQYPPTKRLREDERELMWKFRYSLTAEKRALTKLLKCVDWADSREVYHARQLLQHWVPVDVQDLLELLGNAFVSAAPWVREFAVTALRERATDSQLLSYLLPLVQSIQYEQALLQPPQETAPARHRRLVLFWPLTSARRTPSPRSFPTQLPWQECPLAALLIRKALCNLRIANFLHWYLEVERRDPRHGSHFVQVHDSFLEQLHAASPEFATALQRQAGLIGALSQASQALKHSSESRPRRIARLQAMFEPPEPLAPLLSLTTPLVMPLDPCVRLYAAVPSRATVFKSAMSPLSLTFETRTFIDSGAEGPTIEGPAAVATCGHRPRLNTAHSATSSPNTLSNSSPFNPAGQPEPSRPSAYSVMFKSGDDLRQDQLVLQMLMLMDKLLQDQGLDLQLTTYHVLATAPGQGLVQLVPDCLNLAQILAESKNDIRRYLQAQHPAPDAPYGIEPSVFERFVKSSAGYCVTMYILGVGDRHLDNLMMCSNGALFHIDFGYILGHDPKPFPPPMKFSKEMVEAMGGADSKDYIKFRLLCCEAFNILRASSNLILNLLMLMVDAGVADLRGEADVKKVTEKLRLELSNEEASAYFENLIDSSTSALFPQVVERLHQLAQYWRS